MSTILKALRRLEEQKRSTTERPLRDEVVIAPARRTSRSALARAGVAGVVLAFAGAALLFALRFETPAPPPPETAAPPGLPEVAAAPPPPAETTITVAAPERVAPDAVVPVPAAPQDFEIVRPDPNAAPRPLAPLPLPRIEQEEILAEEPSSRAPRIGRRPMPEEYVEEPLEEPIDAAPRTARATARSTAPVRVARTLWHPSPDRRLAWVEVEGQTALREVREGERVGPYVVREIEPTAVLFADGDSEMRREVGP